MTLSSRLQLVKRHRANVLTALAVAMLTTAGLAFIWHDPVADEARADSYGINLASTLAAQGSEAMLQPDALHLSVLVNRMAALPAVRDARFIDANRIVVAESQPAAGSGTRVFEAPIHIGGAMTGQAQITLAADAFSPNPSTRQILATFLLLLCMPVLTMVVVEWPRRRRPVPVVEFPEAEAAAPTGPTWLVLVTLYNQLAHPSEKRRALMQATLAQAEGVTSLYQGRARSITSTGVALEFEQADDVAFNSVCSSFLLLSVLGERLPQAEFRIALHKVNGAAASAEEVADAALLAALAREHTLLVTPDFADTLRKPERLMLSDFEHPMLADVDIVGEQAVAIAGLADGHRGLLEQQVNVVLGYSTPSASTR